MKTKIGILVLALCTTFFTAQAQRTVTTTRATSYDISDNLDLDAVASIFGESKNLEDFEQRLNDPESRISNLDLNEDGYIDYLRVVENSSDQNSLVVIQAVLNEDVYQDVATIEVEKVQNGNHRIQIVGDSYLYGSDYIIEPIFVRTPLIFSFLWGPHYNPWRSPYYWHHYPTWYTYYKPYSPFKYHKRVMGYINYRNTYNRSNTRYNHFGDEYNHIRRNDYATRYPDRAFTNRHEGLKNRQELNERRSYNSEYRERNYDRQRSNNRQYQENRKSNSGRNEGQRNVNENKRPTYNDQSGSMPSPKRGNTTIENNRKREISTTSVPTRSENKVESAKRNSAPREKSGSISGRNRSNSEAKQNQQSEQKTESSKSEQKKENRERRRRE